MSTLPVGMNLLMLYTLLFGGNAAQNGDCCHQAGSCVLYVDKVMESACPGRVAHGSGHGTLQRCILGSGGFAKWGSVPLELMRLLTKF